MRKLLLSFFILGLVSCSKDQLKIDPESTMLARGVCNDSIVRLYTSDLNHEYLSELILEFAENPNDTSELIDFANDLSDRVSDYMAVNYEVDVWEDEVAADDPAAQRAVILAGLMWIAIESDFDIENWPEDGDFSEEPSRFEQCLYQTVMEVIGIEMIKDLIAQYELGVSYSALFKTLKFSVRKTALIFEAAATIISFTMCMLEE